MKFPEEHRVTKNNGEFYKVPPECWTQRGDDFGLFMLNVPLPTTMRGTKMKVRIKKRTWFVIIASAGTERVPWEHVSVRIEYRNTPVRYRNSRLPVWEEMCFVKDMFWHTEERVIQIHPPKSEYVNCHNDVLHLWRPVAGWGDHPFPPKIAV